MRNPMIVSLLAILMAGCSPFHLRESVRVTRDDWTMAGGAPSRANVAREPLAPPLELRWEYDASAGFAPGSAILADSFAFVGNLRGEVHSIHIRTGQGSGARDFGASIIGTPVLGKQILYIALSREEQSLVAYDLENGVVRWQIPAGDIESSPLLLDGKLYVAALGGTVSCVDAATGEALWTSLPAATRRSAAVHASPASDSVSLFVGRDDGSLGAFSLSDGALRWTARTGSAIAGSPVVVSGRVVVASLDGVVTAFDAASGAMLWSRKMGSRLYGAPAADGERLFLGTSGGAFCALRMETGDILWQSPLPSVVSAAPLISGGVVYVGSLDRSLYAFSSTTGERLWRYETKGRIRSTPSILHGYLVLLVEDRSVLAFSLGGLP